MTKGTDLYSKVNPVGAANKKITFAFFLTRNLFKLSNILTLDGLRCGSSEWFARSAAISWNFSNFCDRSKTAISPSFTIMRLSVSSETRAKKLSLFSWFTIMRLLAVRGELVGSQTPALLAVRRFSQMKKKHGWSVRARLDNILNERM